MFKNLIKSFLLLLLVSSCQKTNDFYSDVNDSNKERIDLKKEKGLNLSVSAIKYGENLEISVYVKSIHKSIDLEDINLDINGLESLISKKKVFYTDSGESFRFSKFMEVKNEFNNQIQNEKNIIIYFKFEDPMIEAIDDLNFNIVVKSNLGLINKKITMKRHPRYKFFME